MTAPRFAMILALLVPTAVRATGTLYTDVSLDFSNVDPPWVDSLSHAEYQFKSPLESTPWVWGSHDILGPGYAETGGGNGYWTSFVSGSAVVGQCDYRAYVEATESNNGMSQSALTGAECAPEPQFPKCTARCIVYTTDNSDADGRYVGSVDPWKWTLHCGSTVTFEPHPAAGYEVDHWEGEAYSTSPGPLTLRVFYDNTTERVYFRPLPPPQPPGGGGIIVCDPGHPGCGGNGGSDEPLILDLNGDGIHTTRLETSPVAFDMNADGRLDVTAWTDPQTEEGLLFCDHDHNHVVDGNAELFGNHTPLPDGTIAGSGVEALAAYDKRENGGNEDGAIGPGDSVWGKLRVWVDRDHNGIAEKSETYHLAELGIDAINLTFERFGPERSYGVDESGNFHVLQGSFRQRLHGQSFVYRQIHDVFFRVRYQ